MDIERLLRLNGELNVYIDEIVKTTALPNDAINKIKDDISKLKEKFDFLLLNPRDYTLEGYTAFKELFAHEKCYLIVEGLDIIVSELGYQSHTLVLIDDKGDDAHYLVQFNAFKQDWYLDAYGLFGSLEAIKSRYRDTNIVECKPCDPNDEYFVFHEQYKNRHCELFDALEASAIENHNIESMEEIADFHDLFLLKCGFDVISRLPFKAA